MKNKKLQIFVSSTFTDLKLERQAAVEAILSSGHIPAGMELFSAGDESQMTVIKRWIDESDVYLLILGGRYGSLDSKTNKSYTHLEYDYAVEKNKPLFSIVISENALDQKVKSMGTNAIEQDESGKLKEFKRIVLSNLVKFWDDTKDIKIAIHETISDFAYRKELTGWVRGDDSVNTGFLAEEIARLTKENSELRSLVKHENGSESLYGSLTFAQLAQLLRKEICKIDGEEMNLLDFLLSIAQTISNGSFIGKDEGEACDRLMMFKLVKQSRGEYYFTDDGHNFFLKALSLKEN